jgi:hypothetical protein
MSRTARVAASRTPRCGAVEIAACPVGAGVGRFSSADAVRTAMFKQQAAKTKASSVFMAGIVRDWSAPDRATVRLKSITRPPRDCGYVALGRTVAEEAVVPAGAESG